MKQLDLTQEIRINKDNIEVDVELDFRCYMDEFFALYPMRVEGSIYKGYSLQDFIKEAREDYEKQNYMKVELVKVMVDLPEEL